MISIRVSWLMPADNGASITGYKLYMSEKSDDFKLVYDGV